MKIAFTICSNNYLSQAKLLGDSFLEKNLDYKFYIGLCDQLNDQVDYSVFEAFTIVPIEDLKIPEFESMLYRYSIVELNTAIKPFYILHFLENIKADLVCYIDPDIYVFDSFKCIEDEISNYNCLLTPHILTPIALDAHLPNENMFLNFGLYNLGFVAFRNSTTTITMLNWWAERMKTLCVSDLSKGYFVDQLPMNFLPVFFDGVCVSRNRGLNMANWNLHERKLSKNGDLYMVNENTPLVFFHYSNYNPLQPDEICYGRQTRFEMKSDKVLKEVFELYSSLLLQNKYLELKEVPCYYVTKRNEQLQLASIKKLRNEKKRYKIARIVKKNTPKYLISITKKFLDLK